MNGETSTFEMETRETFNQILQAISEMRQEVNNRLDRIEIEQSELKKELAEFKNSTERQFEAIRQGLVKNFNQLDRLEAQIAENRMVIFNTKAMVGELGERIYLMTRTTERTL